VNDLHVECANCHGRFTAKAELAGKRVKCPKCHAPMDVPRPQVVDAIETQCPRCFADIRASAHQRGSRVACPTCGTAVTIGGSAAGSAAGPLGVAANPLGTPFVGSPFAGPSSAQHVLARPQRVLQRDASGASLLTQYWLHLFVAGVALVSFLLSLFTGRSVHGVVFLLSGIVITGLGFVFPPSAHRRRAKSKSKWGATIGSTVAGLLFFVFIMLRIIGRMAPRGGLGPELIGFYVGVLLVLFVVCAVLAGLVLGYVAAVRRFGFFRATSTGYSVVALGLPVLWMVLTPRFSPSVDLPRAANVSSVPLPTFHDLGTAQPMSPGVTRQEIRLPIPEGQPGQASRIWVYKPVGLHSEHSLPCVFITGAGALTFTGMELGEEDLPEQLPYAHAGFVVVAYEIDGYLANGESASDQQYLGAVEKYWASQAGMVNARNAIEFALAKVPEIDPEQLFTAGHSSAAIQALLLAANDSRIKACVAYAPMCDYETAVADHVRNLRRIVPHFDDFLKMASPRANEEKLRCQVFLFHAEDDSVVPPSESKEMAARLRAAGKQVELVIVPFGDHYDSMVAQGIPRGIEWLCKFARPAEVPASPGAAPFASGAPGDVAQTGVNPFHGATPPAGFGALPRSPGALRRAWPDSRLRPGPASPFEPGAEGDEPEPASPFPDGDADNRTKAGSIDALLAQLADGNHFEQREALQRIGRMEPSDVSEAERALVAKRLNQLAQRDDMMLQGDVIRTLGTWGDAQSVDALIALLGDHRARLARDDVYFALGRLKDPRAAAPVARRLGEFMEREGAVGCLRALGPLAEDALIAVAPANDADVCIAALTLLGEFGTEKCIDTLRSAQQRTTNPAVRETAKQALRSVRLRTAKGGS